MNEVEEMEAGEVSEELPIADDPGEIEGSGAGSLLQGLGIPELDIAVEGAETSEGEEMLQLAPVAGAVNNVRIVSAVADANPIIMSYGDTADTGLQFQNEQSEVMLILECVASGDNYVTITNGTDHPEVAALGAGTNVNLELIPKGTGYVDVQGGMQEEAQAVTPNNVNAVKLLKTLRLFCDPPKILGNGAAVLLNHLRSLF